MNNVFNARKVFINFIGWKVFIKNAQKVLSFFITTPKEQMVTLDLMGFMMNGEDIKVKKTRTTWTLLTC